MPTRSVKAHAAGERVIDFLPPRRARAKEGSTIVNTTAHTSERAQTTPTKKDAAKKAPAKRQTKAPKRKT